MHAYAKIYDIVYAAIKKPAHVDDWLFTIFTNIGFEHNHFLTGKQGHDHAVIKHDYTKL